MLGTPCFLLLPERDPAKRLANAGPKNTPVPFLLGWPESAALLLEFAGEGEFGGAALVAGSMVKPEEGMTSRVSGVQSPVVGATIDHALLPDYKTELRSCLGLVLLSPKDYTLVPSLNALCSRPGGLASLQIMRVRGFDVSQRR
jgi:hypothetical protein